MSDFQNGSKKTAFLPFVVLGLLLFVFSCESPKQTNSWFAFSSKNSLEQGITGMSAWLESPAGLHGPLGMKEDRLIFEDGSPVKFWGTNICSALPYSSAEKADSFANFLAKYGVNSVRFHKFSWHGYAENYSTRLDDEKWKNLDYFQSSLKEKGIYFGWSHIYGHRVRPGDSAKMVAYEEIRDIEVPWSHLNASTSGLVNFAPDLQDLSIELTVHMLNHVNPHTGLRYADDPALAFIEFQNEDNIFWSAIEKALDQAPTYRSMLCHQFSSWLKDKYSSMEKLIAAWGAENIPEGETLKKMNIYPSPNHGLFSWEYETALKEDRPMARHILDKLDFLLEKQLEFYARFEKAIRETGYKGVLVASCWQAGSGVSHFYNLYADYKTGMIDRHNYFGGGAGGHRLDTGSVKNASMLSRPGSGLLSTGMQMVEDRPFAFSEWMSLVPNQWTAEAAPIIAAYGMGLQGWDASFSFATDIPRFSRLLESEKHGVYNATSPLHMGLYPVLARMIYRGDLEEGEMLATRNVHVPSLSKGKIGFDERVVQGYDDKYITGDFPSELLAAGKIPVAFTANYKESNPPDVEELWDREAREVRSATGELNWRYGDHPHFTIHTSHTRGMVGFLPEGLETGGAIKIKTRNDFAVILMTSRDEKALDESQDILLVAVARGKNTGMRYTPAGDTLLKRGQAPLLLEPVAMELSFSGERNYEVEILDHDGLPTGSYIPVNDNIAEIDGNETKTYLYHITSKNN